MPRPSYQVALKWRYSPAHKIALAATALIHRVPHFSPFSELRTAEKIKKAKINAGMEKRSIWDKVSPNRKDRTRVRPRNFKEGSLKCSKRSIGRKASSSGPMNWSSPAPGIVSRHGRVRTE